MPAAWRLTCQRSPREDSRAAYIHAIGGVPTSLPVNLVLSLLFGAGQLLAGGAVAFRLLTRSEWRRLNHFTLLLIALWFVASGVTELFVSGMETLHDLRGTPTAAVSTLWRGRADTALIAVSGMLILVLLAALGIRQMRRLARVR